MVSDLLEFLDAQRIPRAHLIGHSMGGKVAMSFAARYPDRVLKLVVVDIAPRAYRAHHDDLIEALLSLDLKKLKSREEASAILQSAQRAGTPVSPDKPEAGSERELCMEGWPGGYPSKSPRVDKRFAYGQNVLR
jgi:pimeloyl-ACP methyl ester carboxylesterase